MSKKIAALVGALALASTSALASFVWDFEFTSDTNPRLSTGEGGGTATITPGAMGEGWLPGTTLGLDADKGYWDLGKFGTISVAFDGSVPSGLEAESVKVLQFVSGYSGFFTGELIATIGATTLTSPALTALPILGGAGGSWVVYDWTVPSGTLLDQITITSPGTGAAISQITITAVPEASTYVAGALSLGVFGFGWLRQSWKNRARS